MERVRLRPYGPGDAAATRDVFFRAVRETARADYTAEQVAAWAPAAVDLDGWHERLLRNRTVVAVDDEGRVLGFSDADEDGFVDMLFVLPDVVGRGIAGALLDHVLERARSEGATSAGTRASLTARGFFEHKGFRVVEEHHPVRQGVRLTNFLMTRPLTARDADR